MFLARRPSRQFIERFIRDSHDLPLSFSDVGLVNAAPAGYTLDQACITLGRGAATLERAKAALTAWKHFDITWVELFPRDAPIRPGIVVAVLVRHLGFWSLNGCRIVYALGDGTQKPFGFAYATLSNHVERGEEVFEVFRLAESDEIVYRIRAVSQPRAALARLGSPIARRLQARFRRDSCDAMRRAIGALH